MKKYPQDIMNKVRTTLWSLEDNIVMIKSDASSRRALMGKSGLLERTLGNNFSVHNYEAMYVDDIRGETETEFGEFMSALKEYDSGPSTPRAVELLLEAGDLIFMNTMLNLYYTQEENYGEVQQLFDSALTFSQNKITVRGYTLPLVMSLAIQKHSMRNVLRINGYTPKDKELEHVICTEKLHEFYQGTRP